MISRFKIKSEEVVESLERLVNHSSGSKQTEQIFIVVDNDLWWRLYWNPLIKKWEVTCHSDQRWQTTLYLSKSALLPLIREKRPSLMKARGFEYKTPAGITVFKL